MVGIPTAAELLCKPFFSANKVLVIYDLKKIKRVSEMNHNISKYDILRIFSESPVYINFTFFIVIIYNLKKLLLGVNNDEDAESFI